MLPLEGIRVLDLGRIVAGPFATQMLGDLGAEVIKVERPGAGDLSREYGPSFLKEPDGGSVSGFYLSFNRNKKSISVNLASAEGQQLIRDLAAHCDVFIENFKCGDLARKGLGYDDVVKINPGIVYCSITGFGQTGPYASYPGLDMVFQAMSGLMSVTGEAAGAPQKVGITAADILCGLYASNAIMAALRARDRDGGQGQYIDMSLFDCAVAAMSHRATDYFLMGEAPMRSGNVAPGSTPAQVFTCSDGLLNLQAASDTQFLTFCKAIDRPELAQDPRFSQRKTRHENRAELLPILEDVLRQDTVAHWYERLVPQGVICSPIYDLEQTFHDPQVIARGLQTAMERAEGDPASTVRNPIRYSRTPIERYAFPPQTGAHTDAILSDLLGLSDAELLALHEADTI